MSAEEATEKVDLLLPTFKVAEQRKDTIGEKFCKETKVEEETTKQEFWVSEAQFTGLVEL